MTKSDSFIVTLVHEVAHMLRLDIDRRLKSHDLTRVQWLALQHIKRRPGLTQTELAGELNLGAASVGRLLDRLQDRAMVQRLPAPNDRRAVRLDLTDKARFTLEQLEQLPDQLHEDLTGGMSEVEVASLQKCLGKLRTSLRRKLSIAPAGLAMLETWEGTELLAILVMPAVT
jgi:MarR family transcriptional regulator for hemolysin